MPRAFSGGGRSSPTPSLTPESARGAPVWPARSSGRPGAPSQGQGFAAHPGAVALHGHGMEAGPQFQVRPGAASAPPAAAGVRSGVALHPAPGADGTTVRASQPPDLARRGQGEDGGGTPPKRRAGRPRTRAAADGSDTMRPASLAGPVRPALVSIRRVGLGEGRSSPWSWGVQKGGTCAPPFAYQDTNVVSTLLPAATRDHGHPPRGGRRHPGSPKASRTCEPGSPGATASACSTCCSPTSACARWPRPRPGTGSGS